MTESLSHPPEDSKHELRKHVSPEDREVRIDMLSAEDSTILELFLREFNHASLAGKPHEHYADALLRATSSTLVDPRDGDEIDKYQFRLTAIANKADIYDEATYAHYMDDPTFSYIIDKTKQAAASAEFKNHTSERKAAIRLAELYAGQPLQRTDTRRDDAWMAICDRLFRR